MKKLLYFALIASAVTSCKKFVDVNQNPNSPTDISPKVILPTTTIGLGWANGNELGGAAGVIMQYNAGLTNNLAAYDVYNLSGSFGNQWSFEIYNGVVNNLEIIIGKTSESSPAYAGIAKLQKAYIFSLATDLWGDVPYSQAGQGLKYPEPRFDSQEEIYMGNSTKGIVSLIDLVKSGIADLAKTSTLAPTSDDIVYGGNLTKWKRMGNSLLLKLAIQISGKKPTEAKAIIDAVITDNNFINDNTLDFNIPFQAAVGNQNPMYARDVAGTFKDGEMLSKRFLDLMKANNDTLRLAKYYTKPNGVFTSWVNGATGTFPSVATRSRYNTYVIGDTGRAPIRLLTNFQTQFNLAEAALKLGTAGDANALFQAGIRASMALTGMTTTEINTYFTNNPTIVTLSGTTQNKLQQIITQKYIAWVGNPVESFNDYRRTGFPALVLPLNTTGDDPTTVPKRFPYIATEGNTNPNQPNPRPKTNEKVWWGI